MADNPPPPDDPSIPDEACLLRRISEYWVVQGQGSMRPSSQAFQDQTDRNGTTAMSVYVEDRLESLGLAADVVLDGLDEYGFVAFQAGAARSAGLGIVWAPQPEEGPRGQAHAHVFCKKTGGTQKKLVAAAVIRVVPRAAGG